MTANTKNDNNQRRLLSDNVKAHLSTYHRTQKHICTFHLPHLSLHSELYNVAVQCNVASNQKNNQSSGQARPKFPTNHELLKPEETPFMR